MPLLLALLPSLLGLAPQLARWIGGDATGRVADQVADVVRIVTKTDDPSAAAEAIRDPAVAAQLQIQLAQIAAAEAKAERDAEQQHLATIIADASDARRQTIALTQAGSAIAWGAPACSIIVLLAFGVMLWVVLTKPVPADSRDLANIMLGTLATMASSVVGYWVGSSAGSARKDERMLLPSAPQIALQAAAAPAKAMRR